MKVCITGSLNYSNTNLLKQVVYNLYTTYPDIEICTLGNISGVDAIIRKIALQLEGLKFTEFNPGHTLRTRYSGLPMHLFKKPYNKRNFLIRNSVAASYVTHAMILIQKETELQDPILQDFIQNLEKYNKEYEYTLT